MDGEQNALEPKKVEGQVLPPLSARDARWKFIRDVAVFELKLTLNNFHNFFQVPLTLGIALFDLIFKHGEEGSRFYWVVEQGRLIDDHIDIYSIVDDRERAMNRNYTGSRSALADRLAFPGGHTLSGFPRTLVVNAERDNMRASGDLFAVELVDAGVDVRHHVLPGTRHAFLNRPGLAEYAQAVALVAEWTRGG